MKVEYGTKSMPMAQVRQQASTIFLAKVFTWMALGLGLTAFIAFLAMQSGVALLVATTPLWLILILGELGLVFYLVARVHKMQAATATTLFIAYSALNGLTLAAILLRYTGASIAGTFLITAGMFAAMAIYGLVTKRDLSGMGSFLIMGLFGLIIASVVNIFMASSMIHWIISAVGVLIFTGLTAYDVQKIKEMGEEGMMAEGESHIMRYTIMGALTLYLDFVNLFIMLLQFFGIGGSND